MRKLILFITIISISSCQTDQIRSKNDFFSNKNGAKIKKNLVFIPKNFKQNPPDSKELANNFYSLDLYARQFVHGDMIYAELIPYKDLKFSNLKISVNSIPLPLKQNNWGYRGFFAIHPEVENRRVTFDISFMVDRKFIRELHTFDLDEKQFPVSKSSLDIGKYSRTDLPVNLQLQERITREFKLKESIFKLESPDQLTGILSHPRNIHHLTSLFYEKRIYEQYEIQHGKKVERKPSVSFHRGLDFFARWGDPVFSMASGKVVLAENLYYEGNCVIIDHGSKILSIYMHMSKLNAREGQIIKPGDLIGYAGSTGMSTGAHLHVSLYVNGIPADPLSLLFLPIRD